MVPGIAMRHDMKNPHPEPPDQPSDAERLLGGYATEILTNAEKCELFEAALEDQELFNALADEEALRELLSDPAHRGHLIEVLDQSLKPSPKVAPALPLWRRPLWMGLAATLVLAASTHLILTRNPHIQDMALPSPASPQLEPPPEPRVKDLRQSTEQKMEADGVQLRKKQDESPARQYQKSDIQPSKETKQESPQMTVSDELSSVEKKAPMPSVSLEAAPKAQIAGQIEALSARPQSVSPGPAPARMTKSRPAMDAGFAESEASQTKQTSMEPQVQLIPSGEGQIAVKITWKPKGHLYVTVRKNASIRILKAVSAITQSDGFVCHRYEWQTQEGEALEVYLLDAPLPPGTSLNHLEALSRWHIKHKAPR